MKEKNTKARASIRLSKGIEVKEKSYSKKEKEQWFTNLQASKSNLNAEDWEVVIGVFSD
jgi:hypothetical protein